MYKIFFIILISVCFSILNFDMSLDFKLSNFFLRLTEEKMLFKEISKKSKLQRVRTKKNGDYELLEFLFNDEKVVTIQLLNDQIEKMYYFIDLESVEKLIYTE
jgi:hypothetical protein